jgi:CheY-like chemotaxis protein
VILALIPDLWFLSRVQAAAAERGARVVSVRRAERLAAAATATPPALVIVDMGTGTRGQDWAAAIGAVKALPGAAPVVAFGPHVDAAAQAAARAAGADRVLSNSRLTETLPDLLARYLPAT